MTKTIHPVDATAGAPSYSGRMLRQVGSVGFASASGTDPFGARSGVRPGTSVTTVTATSTTWTVGPHAGLLDFEAAMEAGPTPYAIDANVTGAMRAADAFARVDLVWVRQDIPVEDGAAVPDVVPGYTYGTVASTPPATPARCMVLAKVNVPTSGAPSVTWVAPYAVAAGAPIPVYSQAERDALTAYDGLSVKRLDTDVIETHNGTSWVGPVGASMGTPTATASAGTATSGATETRDAVLGNYAFTAVAGRRYRAVIDGLVVSGTAGDVVGVRVRNGGGSTPTAASTQVAAAQIVPPASGGTGQQSLPVGGTFMPGAGTVTLSAFTVRISGTGAAETPIGTRELYAVDLGPA